MRNPFQLVLTAALLLATASPAQTPAKQLTFDVATVKLSPPPDMAKMMAGFRAGRRPDTTEINGTRAVFTYNSLKQLVAYAYKVRVYQVDGPPWLTTDRFDVVAKLPDNTSRDDVPAMLQALLLERFKLTAHTETKEHPVLGLVLAKGGAKLKESTDPVVALDESAPLKPGETMANTIDGPVRLTHNPDGSTTYNVGDRGIFTLKVDGDTGTMHMDAAGMTLKGFANMLTTLGGGAGRPVIDMTGLTGRYELAVEFSLTDLVSSLRDQGIDIPGRPGPTSGGEASEPTGNSTVSEALQKLGLKLESRKAMIEQLVVDHVEKMPTEN